MPAAANEGAMRMSRRPLAAWIATVVMIGSVLAFGGVSAAMGSGPATPRANAFPSAQGPLSNVIVFLRDQHGSLPAGQALGRTLQAHGAQRVTVGTALPFVLASVTSAQEAALKANPGVQAVFADVSIPAPKLAIPAEPRFAATAHAAASQAPCGTANAPESDPEALAVIKAPAALKSGIDGAGIKTAYMAGGIDTTIADFQRNAKYASSGS